MIPNVWPIWYTTRVSEAIACKLGHIPSIIVHSVVEQQRIPILLDLYQTHYVVQEGCKKCMRQLQRHIANGLPYDIVLNRRLSMWFSPDREQAGCQKKRGCLEHLLTLRLLIDYAKEALHHFH